MSKALCPCGVVATLLSRARTFPSLQKVPLDNAELSRSRDSQSGLWTSSPGSQLEMQTLLHQNRHGLAGLGESHCSGTRCPSGGCGRGGPVIPPVTAGLRAPSRPPDCASTNLHTVCVPDKASTCPWQSQKAETLNGGMFSVSINLFLCIKCPFELSYDDTCSFSFLGGDVLIWQNKRLAIGIDLPHSPFLKNTFY